MHTVVGKQREKITAFTVIVSAKYSARFSARPRRFKGSNFRKQPDAMCCDKKRSKRSELCRWKTVLACVARCVLNNNGAQYQQRADLSQPIRQTCDAATSRLLYLFISIKP